MFIINLFRDINVTRILYKSNQTYVMKLKKTMVI
jgi:hypothetical protein